MGCSHVCLVRNEDIKIFWAQARRIEGFGGSLGHRVGRPLEDRVALHPQGGPVRVAVLGVIHRPVPRRGLLDQRSLVAIGSPDNGTDGWFGAWPDDGGTSAVGKEESGGPIA